MCECLNELSKSCSKSIETMLSGKYSTKDSRQSIKSNAFDKTTNKIDSKKSHTHTHKSFMMKIYSFKMYYVLRINNNIIIITIIVACRTQQEQILEFCQLSMDKYKTEMFYSHGECKVDFKTEQKK